VLIGRVALHLEETEDEPLEAAARRLAGVVEQRRELAPALLRVALVQRQEERRLVRVVLVERSDRDAGLLRDAVRVERRRAVPRENASRRLEDRLGRAARTLLTRGFPRG
jgi:hypothetical protein